LAAAGRFLLDLRFVAWHAEGLGVLEDVLAAFCDGRDVITMKVSGVRCADVTALDTGVVVTFEARAS
jgi:hypothetical protein